MPHAYVDVAKFLYHMQACVLYEKYDKTINNRIVDSRNMATNPQNLLVMVQKCSYLHQHYLKTTLLVNLKQMLQSLGAILTGISKVLAQARE